MLMNRALLIAILIFTITLFPVSALKVGVYDNPPLVFVENGEVKGFYIDVLKAIAEEEGWELDYVYDSFPNLLDKLERGEIDLMVAIAHVEERARIYKFSNETVFTNWGEIVSTERLDSILDLAGMRIAGVKGDVYTKELKRLVGEFYIDCEIIEIEGDYKEVFDAVKTGKADAGIVSRIYASLYAEKEGLKRTSIVFGPVDLRFAGTDSAVLERIDHHLSQMKQNHDSVYYQSLDRWFGVREVIFPAWIYPVVATLLSVLLLVLVFAFAINTYLGRKVAEKTKELREKEEFLRAVFNSIQEGISVLDENMNILMVNPTMEKWYGNVVGKKCYEAYHGRNSICENCPTVKAIESKQMSYAVVPGPGGKGWVELYCYPVLENGKVKMVVEFVRDITEKKRMQEELERLLEKYRYLWNNANDIFYVHDLEGKILDFNRRAAEVFGKAKIETIWQVIPESQHDFIRGVIDEIVRTKQPYGPFEVHVRFGNAEMWLEVIAHPVVENGEVVAIHGIARDITERIKLLEEISENIKLVAFLVDRIRNPLAAARAFCEIRDKVGDEVYERVINNIDRVTELISDLDKLWGNLERLRRGLRRP